MADSKDPSNDKPRRHADCAFTTPRRSACVFSPWTGLSIFFVLSLALIPITDAVEDIVRDYTHCFKYNTKKTCADVIKNNKTDDCICMFEVDVPRGFDVNEDVYFYYRLTNFNINLYESKDMNQLKGNLTSNPACKESALDKDRKPIAPCGALANAMFTDSFRLKPIDVLEKDVQMLSTGIADDADKKMFRNPPGDLEKAFAGYAKPPAWKVPVTELDKKNSNNNGFQNEDFIVWMHTETSNNITKPYRQLDRANNKYKNGLPMGTYNLFVNYNWLFSDVSKKEFVISLKKPYTKNVEPDATMTEQPIQESNTSETAEYDHYTPNISETASITNTTTPAPVSGAPNVSTSALHLLLCVLFFIAHVLRE